MTAATLSSLPLEARLIVERLKHGLAAERIYLFGSHARGEAGPDSDFDFLIVVPESASSRYDRAVEARRLVSDIFAPKDIIVLTRQEWEADKEVVCSLASTVLREGVRLDEE